MFESIWYRTTPKSTKAINTGARATWRHYTFVCFRKSIHCTAWLKQTNLQVYFVLFKRGKKTKKPSKWWVFPHFHSSPTHLLGISNKISPNQLEFIAIFPHRKKTAFRACKMTPTYAIMSHRSIRIANGPTTAYRFSFRSDSFGSNKLIEFA